MKQKFSAIICLLLPFSFLRIFFLNLMGNKISYQAKIGWGVYLINKMEIKAGAKIYALNFIRINNVHLLENSFIKSLNYFKGPFDLFLGEKSGIARQNKIRRAYKPITYGVSKLKLGYNTFIVSNNFLDLTRSITIGDNSQIGGKGAEFWTHGYMHDNVGEGRIRIDGEIHLGNNVYVGSRCLFNPGVTVNNAINIGGNSVISKDLIEPGMYVNQTLRYIKKDIENVKDKFSAFKEEEVLEKVYVKK